MPLPKNRIVPEETLYFVRKLRLAQIAVEN